jgi:hypothetical protein
MNRAALRIGPWAVAAYLVLAPTSPAAAALPAEGTPPRFAIQLAEDVAEGPVSARVVLYLSPDLDGEPRLGHRWTSRHPILGQFVEKLAPGELRPLRSLVGYPHAPSALPVGRYAVQAVLHTHIDEPHSGKAPGNAISRPITITVGPGESLPVRLVLDRRVPDRGPARETDRIKTIELRSHLLSDFHGRDVFLKAVVILPGEYARAPKRRYGSLYLIPGFGGDEREATGYASMFARNGAPFVRVALDGTCPLGHHVFADSDNNGPFGRALVEEMIPHLEKRFRLIAEPEARLLTGHSSGGWSGLWLQINYPDAFGGVWATAPDSVDFHDFCGIDLYDDDANFLFDDDGAPRPIMRRGGEVKLFLPDFVRMEEVIGPGGQIGSFEAVFGPRGDDGAPAQLFDRTTGKIDAAVVRHWRRYDIVDRLARDWSRLGPKLDGKITVLMGAEDDFYLDGAVRRMMRAMQDLGADARIEIVPNCDHSTLFRTTPFREIIGEIGDRLGALPVASPPTSQEMKRP